MCTDKNGNSLLKLFKKKFDLETAKYTGKARQTHAKLKTAYVKCQFDLSSDNV